MTKIAHPIIEFADVIKSNGIECSEDLAPSNKVVKRFIRLGDADDFLDFSGCIT
jgi:hypothetical protein